MLLLVISLLALTLSLLSRPHSPERCSQLTADDGNVGLLATTGPRLNPPPLSHSPHTSHLVETIRRQNQVKHPVLLRDNHNQFIADQENII